MAVSRSYFFFLFFFFGFFFFVLGSYSLHVAREVGVAVSQ